MRPSTKNDDFILCRLSAGAAQAAELVAVQKGRKEASRPWPPVRKVSAAMADQKFSQIRIAQDEFDARMLAKRQAKEEDGLREATFEPMQTAPPPLARLPGAVHTKQLGGQEIYAAGGWPPSLSGQPPSLENGLLATVAMRGGGGSAPLSPPELLEERRNSASPLKLVKSSSDGDAETMKIISEIALGDDDGLHSHHGAAVAQQQRAEERAAAAAAMEMTPMAFVDSVWPPPQHDTAAQQQVDLEMAVSGEKAAMIQKVAGWIALQEYEQAASWQEEEEEQAASWQEEEEEEQAAAGEYMYEHAPPPAAGGFWTQNDGFWTQNDGF